MVFMMNVVVATKLISILVELSSHFLCCITRRLHLLLSLTRLLFVALQLVSLLSIYFMRRLDRGVVGLLPLYLLHSKARPIAQTMPHLLLQRPFLTLLDFIFITQDDTISFCWCRSVIPDDCLYYHTILHLFIPTSNESIRSSLVDLKTLNFLGDNI